MQASLLSRVVLIIIDQDLSSWRGESLDTWISILWFRDWSGSAVHRGGKLLVYIQTAGAGHCPTFCI